MESLTKQEVEETINKMTNEYIDKMMSKDTVKSFKEQIAGTINNIFSKHDINFKYKLKQKGRNINIVFHDMYSALRFYGVNVDYKKIANKNTYKTKAGTYIFKNGGISFRYNKPVKYIMVTVKLPKRKEK